MMKIITNKELIRLDIKRIIKNESLKKRVDSLYAELYQTWHGCTPSPMRMTDQWIQARVNFIRKMEEFYAF